jgi:hypothetical protein
MIRHRIEARISTISRVTTMTTKATIEVINNFYVDREGSNYENDASDVNALSVAYLLAKGQLSP